MEKREKMGVLSAPIIMTILFGTNDHHNRGREFQPEYEFIFFIL